jgi:serpin B
VRAKRRLVVAFAVTAILATACGTDAEPGTSAAAAASSPGGSSTTLPAATTVPMSGDLVRADVPRQTVTDVTDAELAALVAGNTEFAFDLFHAAAAGDNLLISPYSVAAALTMTYAGARGPTAEEMRAALALGLADDRIHSGRNELDLHISAEPEPSPEDDREPFAIRVANSLWGQAGYPFLDEFLALLAENYDAGMNLVDFQVAADDARQEINEWVEDRTEGRIVDLIPSGVITELTRLVVVNAIWFKANWAEQFEPSLTTDGRFATLGGADVTVPMMHGGGRFLHASGEGFQVVRIPYAGGASMVVVVPDEGRYHEIVTAFGPIELTAVLRAADTRQVELTMPRFEFRSELALKPMLEDLGMSTAFKDPLAADGADLTGMTERRQLFVQEVVHQAFITVDEQGTEAAAATAVVVGATSASEPAVVTLDRPFLFLIQHDGTGEVLLVGQVTDPS